jgi:hypothetical protein
MVGGSGESSNFMSGVNENILYTSPLPKNQITYQWTAYSSSEVHALKKATLSYCPKIHEEPDIALCLQVKIDFLLRNT